MGILESIIDTIKSISGGVKSREQMEQELDRLAAKQSEHLNWRDSIVDLMKLTGQDSSLEHRKTLAQELGYMGPLDGSAAMNTWLHSKVMEKLSRTF